MKSSVNDIQRNINRIFDGRLGETKKRRIAMLESDMRDIQARFQAMMFGTKETGPGFYDVRSVTHKIKVRTQHTEAEWFELYGRFCVSERANDKVEIIHGLFCDGHRSERLWNDMQQAVGK